MARGARSSEKIKEDEFSTLRNAGSIDIKRVIAVGTSQNSTRVDTRLPIPFRACIPRFFLEKLGGSILRSSGPHTVAPPPPSCG